MCWTGYNVDGVDGIGSEVELVAGGLLKPWTFRTAWKGKDFGLLIRSRTSIEVVHPMEYSGLPAAAQSGSNAGAANAAPSGHILDCWIMN
jgi:hypothetical protein